MAIETILPVTEVYSFNEAWELATDTKISFDYYQGMAQKINYIKQADRWFITEDKKLYYSYKTNDGIRIVHEASPISCLSNHAFQYVQIMVVPKSCERAGLTVDGKGKLRFSGTFVDRKNAIKISNDGEVFAFNK